MGSKNPFTTFYWFVFTVVSNTGSEDFLQLTLVNSGTET